MLSFDLGDLRFQYRVAAVALTDDHLLVARSDGADFCFLPGGRVEAGETAIDALAREMREELGVEVEVGRLVWVVENFFPGAGRRYHEISLLFSVAVPDQIRHTSFTRRDPVDGITLCWEPLAGLDRVKLQPAFLRAGVGAMPECAALVIVRDD